jgi:nickel superoxide dismutase
MLPLLFLPVFLAPTAPAPAPARALHCQIPCGIYGDQMRIHMLLEDAATIEKSMKTIRAMEESGEINNNQMVRWVMNKDEHAARIQEMVASYWLAQRIKAPAEGAGAEATKEYFEKLRLLHGILVTAMKCKQTTDLAQVEKLRELAMDFQNAYFTKEDLEHLQEHAAGERR